MMESRACYGYYGEGHGATGESKPKKEHASGYSFNDYVFRIEGIGHYEYPQMEVKAIDFAHAVTAIEKQAKKDHFKIIEYIGKNV